MVCVTAWTYMVEHFGDPREASNISWYVHCSQKDTAEIDAVYVHRTVAFSIAITVSAHRIMK